MIRVISILMLAALGACSHSGDDDVGKTMQAANAVLEDVPSDQGGNSA